MFRYRLHSPGGDDLGEATYAQMIQPGDEIYLGAGQAVRVLDVVPFEEARPLLGDSPRIGLPTTEGPRLRALRSRTRVLYEQTAGITRPSNSSYPMKGRRSTPYCASPP
jgi:hypothetical protein